MVVVVVGFLKRKKEEEDDDDVGLGVKMYEAKSLHSDCGLGYDCYRRRFLVPMPVVS